MLNIPIIRIELEGVKQTVSTMLSHSNAEISELVTKSIEAQINEDWVIEHINNTVKNMLEAAIEDMATNWELRQAISNLVSSSVARMISAREDNR